MSTSLFAQKQLEPFEDYKRCLTGFLNKETGDTIFPAKFENLRPISRRMADSETGKWPFDGRYWIVSENGKYGCLNISGDWFFQPQFEYLEFNYVDQQQFIITNKGKTGTLNWNKDTIFPFIYDKLYNTYPSHRFVAVKGKKMGLYTFGAEEVIPIRFDTLYPIFTGYYHITDRPEDFYITRNRKKCGLYTSTGTLLLQQQYQQINFSGQFYTDSEACFEVHQKGKKSAIFNSKGEQLTDYTSYEKFLVFNVRKYHYDSTFRYLKELNGKVMRLVTLKDQNASEWYDQMNFVGDLIFATKGAEWRILDTNYKEVFVQHNPNDQLLWFSHSGGKNHVSFANRDVRDPVYDITAGGHNNSTPEIFLIGRNTDANTSGIKQVYGVLNPKTWLLSEVCYQEVYEIKGTYWAIRPKSAPTEKSVKVDVFDFGGNLLRSIDLSDEERKSLQSYKYSYSNQTEFPMYCYKNESGKYSSRWFNGKQPEVNVFDDPWGEMLLRADSTGFYIFKTADHHYYFRDLKNQPLLNGSVFDYCGFNSGKLLRNDEHLLFFLKKNDEYLITDRNLNPLIDSCKQYWSSSDEFIVGNRVYSILFLRHGIVYGYSDGEIIRVDSSHFVPGKKIYDVTEYLHFDAQGNYLSNEDVAVLQLEEEQHIGSLTLKVINKELIVYSSETKQEQRFQDVKDYQWVSTYYVAVRFYNGKVGWMNYRSGGWSVEPKYDKIQPVGQDNFQYCMVMDKSRNDKQWLALAFNGKELTPPIFDEPTPGKSNGKYGVLDENWGWSVPPIYDAIKYINNSTILVKDKDYVFLDPTTRKVFSVVHDSVYFAGEKYVFFSHDSIQIIDIHGKTLLKRMKIKDALQTEDLQHVLYAQEYVPEYLISLQRIEKSKPLIRKRNELIFQKLSWNAFTKDEILNFIYGYYADKKKFDRNVLSSSQHRYVETISGKGYDGYNEHDCTFHGLYQVKYRNYRVSGDSLVEIENIEELFLPTAEAREKLSLILQKEIQRTQYYGLACVDMKSAANQVKAHFWIDEGKIMFLDCDYHDYPLEVSIEVLKDVLLYPEVFE